MKRALAAVARPTLLCCAVAAFCCALAPQFNRLTLHAAAPPADAPAALAPDKGKFVILQEGAEVGTETFEISSNGGGWMAKGQTTIHGDKGNPDSHATGQLRLAPDGSPIRYEWTSQAPKKASGSVDFTGATAKTVLILDGKDPFHEDFTFASSHVAILDNNLYDQFAILASFYNWTTKGKQTFPVLIPQDLTPGTIDLESMGLQTTSSGPLEELRASTPDLEIDLYLDARHRLVRLEVPAAKVMVVRQ